jgi:ribosomal protein L37E
MEYRPTAACAACGSATALRMRAWALQQAVHKEHAYTASGRI